MTDTVKTFEEFIPDAPWPPALDKGTTMTKDKELLPCPFCGSIPEKVLYATYRIPHCCCKNEKCPIAYVHIAAAQWNKRGENEMAASPDDYKVFEEVCVLRAENEMLKRESARLDDLNKRILESMVQAQRGGIKWVTLQGVA